MSIRMDEKKKQKREALLTAAFALFTTKGIHETSISEIVRDAGLAKGTFYLYFNDKYDIQDHLITEKGNEVFVHAYQEIEHRKFQTMEDRIFFLIENVLEQFQKNPQLLGFVDKNLSWAIFSNIRFRSMDNKSCMEVIKEMFHRSNRQFRQLDLLVFMMTELVNSTCHSVILHQDPVTIEELKPELRQMIDSMVKQFELPE